MLNVKRYAYYFFGALGQRASITTGAGGVGGTDDVILIADGISGLLKAADTFYIKMAG